MLRDQRNIAPTPRRMKRIHVAWMTVVLWPERRMRQSIIGGSIIKPIKFLPNGGKITRHHHERFNDGGYPDGLKGEDIPLFPRIIAVADYFYAMTSLLSRNSLSGDS